MALSPSPQLAKILVTGGTGFLGRAVATRLAERGFAVTSLARKPDPTLDRRVTQVLGDVSDPAAVLAAVAGAHAVVHTAAKAGIFGAYDDYFRANVLGTQNVLDACRAVGVRQLVHTSSPSVTFDGKDQNGVDETAPYPKRFLAAYPATKAEAERRALGANRDDFAVLALRPHLIWGPGDPHLAPRVIATAKAGTLRLVGGGLKLVDAVYIDNAADAHLAALHALSARPDEVGGRPYFVTNDEPWPLARILNGILGAAGLPRVRRSVPAPAAYAAGAWLEAWHDLLGRDGEPRMTRFVARQLSTAHWYKAEAARNKLGYTPHIGMSEGFARLGAFLRREAHGSPA